MVGKMKTVKPIEHPTRESDDGGDANEPNQFAVIVELQKPQQEEPLRGFADLYLGLHERS